MTASNPPHAAVPDPATGTGAPDTASGTAATTAPETSQAGLEERVDAMLDAAAQTPDTPLEI